jgi:hypothetical protein
MITNPIPDTVYPSEITRNVYIDKEKYNIVKSINLLEWDLLASAINHALMVSASEGEDTIEILDSVTNSKYDKHISIYYGKEKKNVDKVCILHTDSGKDILCYLVDKGYSIRDTGNDFYVIFYNLDSVQKMKYYAESVYDYIMGVGRKEKIEENTEFKLPEVFSNTKFKDAIIERAMREKFNLEEDNSVFLYIVHHLALLFMKNGYTLIWDRETYFARYYKSEEKKDDNMVKQI